MTALPPSGLVCTGISSVEAKPGLQPRSLFYGNNKTRRDSHAPGLYSHSHRRLSDAVNLRHRQIPTNQDNGPNKLCTGHKKL